MSAPTRVARLAARAAALLGSGALGAVGMVVLARGWLPGLRPEASSTLVVFIQWEVLLLTAAKFGADQLVFSMVSGCPQQHVRLRAVLLERSLPVVVVAGAVMAAALGGALAVPAALAALLDAHAVCRVADLGGRGRVREVSVANILNYPVFFLLLVLAGRFGMVTAVTGAWCFVASSAARWVYAVTRPASTAAGDVAWPDVSVLLAAQQVLNYLAFRGDQILLPSVLAAPGSPAAGGYLFLARYPELVGSVLVTLAPLYLVRTYTLAWAPDALARGRARRAVGGLGAALVGGAALFALFAPSALPAAWQLAMGLAAALALPANLVTYALLREANTTRLVRVLAIGVALGATLAAAAWEQGSPEVLAFGPAVALATLVLLGGRAVRGAAA
jgi:hypothetical protein